MNDVINHPDHYQDHSGIECIEIASPLSYSIGNAVKYVYRYDSKDTPLENLKKARWFLNRVIDGETRFGSNQISPTNIPLNLSFENSETYGSVSSREFKDLAADWKNRVLTVAHFRLIDGNPLACAFFLALASGSVISMQDVLNAMIEKLSVEIVDDSDDDPMNSAGDYQGADNQ